MKKGVCLILLMLMGVLIGGCDGGKDSIPLTVPANFLISESILSWDEDERTSKYRIYIVAENEELEQASRINVTNGMNLSVLLLEPGTYQIHLQALGDGIQYSDSSLTEALTYVQIDPYQVSSLEGEYMIDKMYLNWFGRTRFNETNQANYFYFTASGFEVTFYGTELTAEFVATNFADASKQPHLTVFIDGNDNPNIAPVLILNAAKKEYTIASGLSEGLHTVKVLKRSESIDSATALTKITTDGRFVAGLNTRPRKIEVIAASSSCGFGNLAENTNVAKTTANSDGLRTYAYLAARMVDAEINIFSASGWPLVRGPWTGTNNIPGVYNKVDVYSPVNWNHSEYVPDLVIINLGTNDWSYINGLSGSAQTAAIQAFKDGYVAFITNIHSLHPNAKFLIIYGLMNETNVFQPTLQAVTMAKAALPSVVIETMQLPGANTMDGIGSSSHPGIKTHIRAGALMAEKIAEMMGWDLAVANITLGEEG